MTISSTTNRVSYSGNGIVTAFSFPYYFLANADLVVISKNTSTGVETTKVITTDYTVTGAGVSSGGTVTMLTAPATGETLTIYRSPAQTQDLDLVENDPMPAEEIEKRFDKLTMIVQRLSDRIDRSIRITDGVSGFSTSLPAALTALKAIRVNSDATALELADESTFDGSSPLTTKGDLIGRNSSQSARVPVGADASVLIAASGETLGVYWFPVGTNGQSLIADSTQPYKIRWGSSAGGSGSLQWVESTDSPTPFVENNNQVYGFQAAISQYLYALVRVPSTYTPGNPIKLKTTIYSPDSTGTALLQSLATLVRTGTDAISTTTNQRTSTNSAATLGAGTVNIPQNTELDLTSTTGTINSVAVSAGDLILIRLTRGTDTSTSDFKVPVYGAEVTFS